jgi:hypothetical protein
VVRPTPSELAGHTARAIVFGTPDGRRRSSRSGEAGLQGKGAILTQFRAFMTLPRCSVSRCWLRRQRPRWRGAGPVGAGRDPSPRADIRSAGSQRWDGWGGVVVGAGDVNGSLRANRKRSPRIDARHPALPRRGEVASVHWACFAPSAIPASGDEDDPHWWR